jgi:hypothetical protein
MSIQRSTLIALVSVLGAGGCAAVNAQKDSQTTRAHCEKNEVVDTRVQQSSATHRPELAFHDHHHHPPTAGASPHYVHGASTYQLAHGDVHDAYVDPTLACYTRPRRSGDVQPTPSVPEPVTSM